MKIITFTFAALIATTSLAHAGSVEKRCWSEITHRAELGGCQFGNDFAPNIRVCLEKRQRIYRLCVLRAQSIKRIGPALKVHIPVNTGVKLRKF